MATTFDHVLQALAFCEAIESDAISYDDLTQLRQEWEAFETEVENLEESTGTTADDWLATVLHPDCDGSVWAQVAHDWVLTRQETGAGFWDGDWHKPQADTLTSLAKEGGPLQVYRGDDGTVYLY